jgi:hypothetical protein
MGYLMSDSGVYVQVSDIGRKETWKDRYSRVGFSGPGDYIRTYFFHTSCLNYIPCHGEIRPCRENPAGSDHAKIQKLTAGHPMNFEEIERIEDLETVSEESVWQNFERLAAFIFEKNEFSVQVNTVKTLNKKRRQYDVIARKCNQTFLIECKKWAGNRYRLSALKRAVAQHKERTLFYRSIMNEDAVPLIVTLIEEEIRVFDGVPIVPVLKLNAFINELDNHADGYSFSHYEEEIPVPEDLPAEPGELPGIGEREP